MGLGVEEEPEVRGFSRSDFVVVVVITGFLSSHSSNGFLKNKILNVLVHVAALVSCKQCYPSH